LPGHIRDLRNPRIGRGARKPFQARWHHLTASREHLLLVAQHAQRYARSLDFDDLFNERILAFLRAADKYDPVVAHASEREGSRVPIR
jgi:DNA-directed RNA polymerase specialized sigma subunit